LNSFLSVPSQLLFLSGALGKREFWEYWGVNYERVAMQIAKANNVGESNAQL
jgi:hypothetical protein